MIKVYAKYTDQWTHVSVLIVGLKLLHNNGQIDLQLVKENNDEMNNQPGMEIIVNGTRVYLDVADGYNNLSFIQKNINDYDIWFKRSFSYELNEQYGFENMLALGLNYEVFDLNTSDIFYKRSIKNLIMQILMMKPSSKIHLKDYEYLPKLNDDPQICFITRLWEDNEEINEMRINLTRALKNKYGSKFHGGIYKTKEAEELCPDLIVNKVYTQKYNYLKQMKKCDICIATSGLHGSIGWKLAEYVMASKVIISEPLNYYVPYGFEKNKNYLEFSSVEECIQIIDSLLLNRNQMIEIMNNNHIYYQQALNAQMLMMKIIEKCLSE